MEIKLLNGTCFEWFQRIVISEQICDIYRIAYSILHYLLNETCMVMIRFTGTLTLSPVQVFWAIKLSLFLGNYTDDHPEIRYAYGSDHPDGLPIGSGIKYPEFPEKFRN